MRQLFLALLAAAFFLALAAEPALAQGSSTWPEFPAVGFERGEGVYLSWLKIVSVWLVFLVWVATTDWANQDAVRHGLPYHRWNAILFFPFLAALMLTWVIPLFVISFPLLLVAYAVPLTLYIRARNRAVESHQTVMTRDHLRFLLAERLKAIGIDISDERAAAREASTSVKLIPGGSDDEIQNKANLELAKRMPAYQETREMLAGAIDQRAEAILLDYTRQQVGVRFEIDGVWHNGEAMERELGDGILAVMKQIAALNPEERRARQAGQFGAAYGGKEYVCKLLTRGTKTGERAVLQLVDQSIAFERPEDLGMREATKKKLLEVINSPPGMVLFSAQPHQGLTTTIDTVLNSTDRFVRSFIAVEDAQRPERRIDNIEVITFDSQEGQTALDVLPGVARQYPDVIVVRELVDGETVKFLCGQVEENRMVISGIHANDAAEALLRVLMLKIPPATFAPCVLAVVNQRLVRRLCDTCKEAYPPPPQILKQLRIPAGKIESLYRPPQNPEEVCPDCQGIGYRGRTAIFELLVVDDRTREVLAQKPKLDLLRRAARAAGMRTLQEEGLLLVLQGVTSLAELSRVLKNQEGRK